MANEKWTAKQMIDAIEQSKGILAQAARIVGCSRHTVTNYIDRYPTVKAAFDEANETTIDYVESQLLKQIGAGVPAATIFFLKTKAKHRGYVERQEHTGKDGEPLVKGYAVISPDDWDDESGN